MFLSYDKVKLKLKTDKQTKGQAQRQNKNNISLIIQSGGIKKFCSELQEISILPVNVKLIYITLALFQSYHD